MKPEIWVGRRILQKPQQQVCNYSISGISFWSRFDFDFRSLKISIRYMCACIVISQVSREKKNCFKKHLGNDIVIIGVEHIFSFSPGRIFQCNQALGQGVSFNVCFVTKSFSKVSCVIICICIVFRSAVYLFCVFDIYVFFFGLF